MSTLGNIDLNLLFSQWRLLINTTELGKPITLITGKIGQPHTFS